MALTDAQKYKIIRYFGYPANTLVEGTLSYSKIITDRLLSVSNEAVVEVADFLSRLSDIEDALSDSVNQSGVKRIDDIEFFGGKDGGDKMTELRREKRRLIKELAGLLDMSVCGGSSVNGNVIV